MVKIPDYSKLQQAIRRKSRPLVLKIADLYLSLRGGPDVRRATSELETADFLGCQCYEIVYFKTLG